MAIPGSQEIHPPPVTVFTFFVALPYPVPIPDKSTQGFVEERTSLWDGWSPDQLGTLVSAGSPFPADIVPGTRMSFRHSEVTVPVPPAAAFDAFKDWIEAPLSADEFKLLEKDTEEWKSSGLQIVTSIVALSRFLPRSAHPRSGEISIRWLLDLFRSALIDLNNFLEAVGLTTKRWDIGVLSPRSLPPMVPILVESSHPDDEGNRQGATTIIPLHDAVFVPAQVFVPNSDLLATAAALSNSASRGQQPYMLVFRLIHGVEGERLAGDVTRAVIDLNTAIEVLVSVTLTEGGRIAGWSEEQISTATDWRTGLKKRVSHYLAELVDQPIDVRDEHSIWGRWFAGGYRLRNAAVHEGRRLKRSDVDSALEEARDVVDELRERLRKNGELLELAEALAVEFGGKPEWEEGIAGLQFPWDP